MKLHDFLFKNISVRQTIVKNIVWLFASQVGGRLIKAALIIYAARILGAAGYGIFSLGLSIAGLFMLFSDIGVSTVMTREIAKDREARPRWIATAFFLKLALLIISLVAIIFLAPYFTKIPEARLLLPLFGLILFLDGLRDFGFFVIRGLEEMQWEAFVNVLVNVIVVGAGLILITYGRTPWHLAVAYLIGSVAGAIMVFFPIKHYFRDLRKNLDRALAGFILSTAWPFIIWGLLGSILVYTDTIMLGWLKDVQTVGFYNAAYKPIQFLFALPWLLAVSIFPTFSRRAKEGDFLAPLAKSLSAVAFVALPLTMGGLILGKPIIATLYGTDYLPGVSAFQVLILLILLQFPASIIGNAVFAYNRHFQMLPYLFLAALMNIVFNRILIPPYGGVGAASATVLAQGIAFIGAVVILKRIQPFSIAPLVWRSFVATLIMGIAVAAVYSLGGGFWFSIFVGGLVYFAFLHLLKEPLLKEVYSLAKLR